MENKQFPNPEEEILPQDNDIPAFEDLAFSPEEDAPRIDDLAFAMEPLELEPKAKAEPLPMEDDSLEELSFAEALSPEAPIPEDTPAEDLPEVNAEALPTAEPPQEAASSFMDRIPDVEADYPPGEDEDLVTLLEDPEYGIVEEDDEDILDQEYRDNGQDFNAMFEAPAPEQKIPSHSRPARKGRPKRKKGEGFFGIPNILATFVWLGLILAIGVTAGRMLWVCAADVLAFGREDKPVTITIYGSDTMDTITDKLYDAGLIRYKSLFNLYASISDAEEDIKPGIYDLNTRYDYHALVNFMTPRSNREVIELTIPEGYTCRQIFQLLEESKICTAVDVAAYAASGELNDYWFLEGVERGSEYCLEGYLFPDTYEFYKNSTPREALQRMLNNFDNRFSEEMRAQIDTLNANVTGGGYTVREVTIVASLIEKESAAPGESPNIAGVIYNRLFRWDGVPAYLNIDASIVYAQNGVTDPIDTSIDSPYNTYTHVGLTPGPIANPGLSSLKAALDPEWHDYYYYVLNPSTGMHQFSTTQEEHNAWINEFYN